MNCEILYVQAGLRKGRGTRDQIANIRWTVEKAKEFQTPTSALLTMQKPHCVDHNKVWETVEIPDHLICLLRNLYAGQEATVGTEHGTIDFPNQERHISRLYNVTVLIKLTCKVHHEKCPTG